MTDIKILISELEVAAGFRILGMNELFRELSELYPDVKAETPESNAENYEIKSRPETPGSSVDTGKKSGSDSDSDDPNISEQARKNRKLMKLLEIEEDTSIKTVCDSTKEDVLHYFDTFIDCPELTQLKELIQNNRRINEGSIRIIDNKINDFVDKVKEYKVEMERKFKVDAENAEWDCAKKAVKSIAKNVDFVLSEGIIKAVIEKLSCNDIDEAMRDFYVKLMKAISSYLKRAGFITYNDAKAGGMDDDRFAKYFKTDNTADTSDISKKGMINVINYLPYITWYSEDDRKKMTVVTGQKTVYVV